MANWGKIHELEARLKYHRVKKSFAHAKLVYWQTQGRKAHEQNNNAQILRCRAEIIKWKRILDPEVTTCFHLEKEIQALKPKTQEYKMGGWVPPGTPSRMQRIDQGQDFEIPIFHHVVAPGYGHCTGWSSDRPFPNGFGSPYATVHITSGLFAGHGDWYLGHANEPIIKPGQSFVPGQPLARLNHGLNAGWGWIELGPLPYGGMTAGAPYHHLFEQSVWH